ncbi:MAG: DUF3794 domain-containing protein, partial [Clostridia bacterium]|nr:DUF3794 domain-containing protein [Clostridia bacterium]
MEQKNLKTPVYANDTVFESTAEIPVDVDFSLPDYCADISKILKCRAVPRISSKGVNGKNVTVDGCVTVTLIYCDEERNLSSYEYQYPFNKVFDVNVDLTGAKLTAKIKCEYINCRAVTGRKVDIHGAVSISLTAKARKCTEVICDVDDSNIELKRGKLPTTSPMGYAEKYLLTEETIEIGQGQPDILSLVRYDAQVSIKECKLLANKAMVKGELTVTMLYCAENGTVQNVRSVIPVSQLIEIDGITDQCECEANAKIAFLEIKPVFDGNSTAKSFSLNSKILICCEAYCNDDIDVIFDAFSRKYEANISKCELCLSKIFKNETSTCNCKKNVKLDDIMIENVLDLWCEVTSSAAKIDNGELTVSGSVLVSLIIKGEDGDISFYEKPIEYEYKCAVESDKNSLVCTPDVTVLNCGFTISSADSLEIRAELNVNACLYDCKRLPVIMDVEINEDKKLEKA